MGITVLRVRVLAQARALGIIYSPSIYLDLRVRAMPVKTNNPLMQYHPVRYYEVRKHSIGQPMNIMLSGLKGDINNIFSIPSDVHI